MKIVYLANVRIPTEKAHGHQIMKMSGVFSDLVEVELVVPTRRNPDFKDQDPFDYYRIKRKFKIKRLRSFDPTFLLKTISGLYIKVQALCFFVPVAFYLYKLRKQDFFIYTRDEYLLPLLSFLKRQIVWEGHALPSNLKKYVKYFNNCHRLVVLTGQMKKQLVEAGVAENKILVSPDAVDLNVFDINLSKEKARQKLDLPQDKFVLCYTGNFKTKGMDKGIKDIIQALSLLNQEIVFVAVGGGQADIQEYRNQAKALGAEGRVILRGKVSQADLAIYQKAADVLMMPFPYAKHYAYYMSPLKMFEYMAGKCPILTTDLPTIKEILTDETACIVEPDQPEQIAKGVEKLKQNADYAKLIANNAYNLVQEYTWEKRAEKIINYIKI